MAIATKGYVLEKPRVGSANSPFTSSPDNVVSDPGTYGSVFDTDETDPGRCEYLVLTCVDGDLPDAEFGWTKNESGVQRFDYDGSNDGFRTLPGSSRQLVGTLGAGSNTSRIQVAIPTASSVVAPYRVSVGSISSGTTFVVATVINDAAFTTPTAGTVQLSLDTGNLNWRPSDLTAYSGQSVYYQRQNFFSRQESNGKLGLASDSLVLNPIPGTGQKPLIRFGFGLHLTPVERATEANFLPNPVSGTVEWALSTGLLKFNSIDLVDNPGEPVYYDGALFALGLTLPRQTLGTVSAPTGISGLPSEGGELIFRAKNGSTVVRQFPVTLRVSSFSSGKSGEVQVEPSGAVQFSDSDIGQYGSRTAEVVFGDLSLERGLAMRFFRSPVDLEGADPALKDVTALVSVESTLADPIIGSPQVFLPVLPIDDVAHPVTVSAVNGTGTYAGTLTRLDVISPPSGLGYTLDFDGRQLSYAQRLNNQVTSITSRTAAVNLPDVLVNPSNALFEINQGAGYSTLTQGVDAILEPTSGVLTFIDKEGVLVVEGASGTVSDPGTLVDLSADFVAAGVQPSDLLLVPSGPLAGVYTVASASTTDIEVTPDFPDVGVASYQVLRGKEILADRFFQEVVLVDPQTKVERLRSLGWVGNSPRLSVEDPYNTRIRLPSGTVVTLAVVAADANFTAPGSLPANIVQVSVDTGNLNFSSSAPSGTATEVRKLTQGVDYRLSPELGFIQFTERMLALDEVWVTYASESAPNTYALERASFLVRKELVTHPVSTSTMPFNPASRSVASTPAPAVFRGGRPQAANQVSVSTSSSTITFLPDVLPTPGGARAVTDALPHGSIVDPSERITVDYYVYGALGGENTITVLNPPIYLTQVVITDGETSFDVLGDWSTTIPASHLLRIGSDQVYHITSSVYDGTKTTITVSQPFRDDFLDPKLFVSSGEIRLVASGVNPAYFVLESAAYDPVPRGMNKVKLGGDLSAVYQTGTVVYFWAIGVSEYYLVTGSKYDASKDKTEVTFSQNSARQYSSPYYSLRRSVRPVFESGVTSLRTKEAPLVVSPAETVQGAVTVFRQTAGDPGVVLGFDEYKIDDSGKIDLAIPLASNEEVSALYTHYRFVNPGTLRSSYTATIAPTADNGLLNQKLLATFTSYIPDSFYFRIETMSAFRSEVAEAYKEEARASTPSGGPRTSNSSSSKLHEQGSESLYFREGDLANEDIIARGTLSFYNDSINHLENLLSNLDGRVVGDRDGLFKFDGTTGSTVASFADADNQIDDKVKLSDFPIDPTPPLFPLKFKGTYLRAYEANADSRFYPTFRRKFGYTVAGADTSAKTGDAILDFETKNLTGTHPTLSRRSPRAVVTQTALSGDNQIFVDTTNQVDTAPYRPPFANGMKVVIQNPNGSFLVPQGSPLEIQSKTSTSITFTASLPASIPIGASVYLADSDTAYRKSYRMGFDLTLDQEKGYALYVKPYPPYDGSVGGVPPELEVQTPDSEELLEAGVFSTNSITAPYRFPALDGSTLDDDGDHRLPLVNPSPEREIGSPGYLETEWRFISNSGEFAVYTEDPFVGTGDIGGGGLTVTLTSGVFPSPVPQPGDLVRTLSGVNGASSFRRVTSVGANSVTVDVAFTVDTGATFLVTVASNLVSGTLSAISGPVITDALANFTLAGIQRGDTVVRTAAGAGQYERRQVLSVDSSTQITLSAPFTNVTFPAAYRVHNPLNTFSDIADLESAPTALLGILSSNSDSEINTVDSFYSEVLTDRLSPVSATGSVTGTALTGAGVDFVASGVQPGDFVYVTPTQSNQGFYLVDDVTGPTTLTVSESFPVAGAITFRVVSVFGVSEEGLDNLLDIRTQTANFHASSTSWASLVSTPVPVLVPPGVTDSTYFARGYLPADIITRRADVDARRNYVPDAVSQVESILASSDRLYDKRYVWIDARINLEKGLLVKQSRAIADRLKAQEETLKQLTKLLAVQ
jgi:hypothetical protein